MNSEKITLSRQTSHKFNAAYAYLNDTEDVGTARLMASKPFRGDADRAFRLLKVQSADSVSNVMQAIRDTFRRACSCEHDCCGHMQTYIGSIRPLKNGFYAVIESSYRNC